MVILGVKIASVPTTADPVCNGDNPLQRRFRLVVTSGKVDKRIVETPPGLVELAGQELFDMINEGRRIDSMAVGMTSVKKRLIKPGVSVNKLRGDLHAVFRDFSDIVQQTR